MYASVAAVSANLGAEYLRFFRDAILNRHYNEHPGLIDGSKWPPGSLAVSMAGQRRLDHVVALIATAAAEGLRLRDHWGKVREHQPSVAPNATIVLPTLGWSECGPSP